VSKVLYDQTLIRYYTPEMVDIAMKIWMRSSVTLIDIRKKEIGYNKPLENYLLPSSMLIYTKGAPASIYLNQQPYQTGNYGLCHAGKGTLLSIYPIDESLQAYMILYKAELVPFYKRNLRSMLETMNPFTQLYGFSPANPIFFLEKFQSMLENWNEKDSMQQFLAKIQFHQIVYKLYIELKQGDIRYIEPDYVEWVKGYLDQHFTEQISIQLLSEMLPISRSLLGKTFRKRENKSLQDYLNNKRLNAAKAYLESTNATIQEIASGCGFLDELNMNRMFKKYVHMTPSEYRRKVSDKFTKSVIDNNSQYLYNEKGLASLAKSHRDGELIMFGQTKSKEMILAAAMSLMLLLTACGSNATGNNGGASNQNTAQTQQTQSASNAETNSGEAAVSTRIVTTIYGDVEVPVNPERVAVWVYEQEIHSLGVTPVSISSGSFESVWPDVEVFSYAPEKEALMSLDPDLLITYDDENFYNEYQSIAPVINIPLNMGSEEALRMIGDLLNVSEKAEEIIQKFNEQAEASKKLLEESNALGKTAVLIEPLADDIWFYDNAYGRGGNVLYDYLDFAIPDVVQEKMGDKHYMNVSFEVLAQYCDADYIVVVTGEGYEALKEKDVWKSIPAVQNNKVIEFDGSKLSGRGLDTETLAHFTESFTSIK